MTVRIPVIVLFILLSGVAFPAPDVRTTKATEITWQDLIPKAPTAIDDPFAELSGEQLMQLAQIVRIRRLLEENKIPADGRAPGPAAAEDSNHEIHPINHRIPLSRPLGASSAT